MNKKVVIQRIELVAATRDELNKSIKVFLEDKMVPIEDRWEVYCLACEKDIITEINGCYFHSKVLNELGVDSFYDYFYIDRYQTEHYVDLVARVEEVLAEKEDGDCYISDCWRNVHLTKAHIDALKEEILALDMEAGFVYDW